MMNRLLIVASLILVLVPTLPRAGWNEGIAAYQSGDYVTALEFIQPLAIKGHVAAQLKLGLMYKNGMFDYGRGVVKDEAEAVSWYHKAAEQGLVEAQYKWAYFYAERGENLDEAEKLIRSALEQQPENAGLWDTLALILHKKGDRVGARKTWVKAIQLAHTIGG